MKELIGKLSRGIIEYDVPELEVSINNIEDNMEQGTIKHGSFEIFCNNDFELKGIVYSTHDALIIKKNQFVGNDNKIDYEVTAKSYEPGMSIEGRINIVSNGGEAYIPFNIGIVAESLPSSIGDISNIFHFVNLAKKEHDEALKMFLSEDFKRIVLKDDIAARSLYNGLISGFDKNRAMEEFILTLNKKQKAEFEISDRVREYDSLTEPYGDIIKISRSNWGYQKITIKADGDFITEYRKNITDEDFAGNNYEFSYIIDTDKLHDGMNYGKITFESISQTVECNITVDNVKQRDISKHEIDKCLKELTEKYINFRLHKKGVENWAEESVALIERARGFDDNKPFLKLLQAQVNISRKFEKEAIWLLDNVAEEILDRKEENIELYCYYLYVRTLQKRELDQTIMATDVIRKYYENGYDSWKLLWILLYIDTSFENNKSLKITRIKEQFRLGCHSPLMYFEALYVFNRQPELLRVINNFELQVLSFGARYGAIELRLATQLANLAMLEKNFKPLLYRILVSIYSKFENKLTLTALLSVLIRGNKTDKKYFKWYALGIAADIKVTRLFEYYIFSMPSDFKGTIPNTVLMYYVYNGNLLYDREAFFYNIIIKNKEIQPNVYKNYKKNIEFFAMQQLRRGIINKNMAVIYADVMNENLITEENVNSLPCILNTWRIKCENKNVSEVIVIHKEVDGEKRYQLNDGVAYVNIFTEDAIILFTDRFSNRYHQSVDYTMEKIYDDKRLSEISYDRNIDNTFLLAKACEQSLKYHKNIGKGITIFKKILDAHEYRKEYADYIMKDIIDYYCNNYDGEDLDGYLLSIDMKRLNFETRNNVLELMIMRGLYGRVYEVLKDYGICRTDPRKLLKYCSRYLKDNENPEPEDIDNILSYCSYSFRKGKYNEVILDFLAKYFNGTTKEMMELFRISNEFSFESRDLEERIIAQMMFTRTHLASMPTIYEAYQKKGAMEMLKKAYLFYESYDYFVKEKPVDDLFFIHLQYDLDTNDNAMDICKCAFLLYNSTKERLNSKTIQLAEKLINELSENGIIFNFYKEYQKWFNLSGNILDKTTIVYRTVPQSKVIINFILETGNLAEKNYEADEMRCVFKGMYIKSFTLFYGENLKYYITEVNGNNSNLTESSNYLLDDRKVEISDSRFGMLNDILSCREMKDDRLVHDLSKEYYEKTELVKKLF